MLTRLTALAMLTLFLAGCNTLQGLGKDIQTGGKKLEEATEKKEKK